MNLFRTTHLPPSVARVLRGFYRRQRLYTFLRGACVTALLYLVLALVAMHLDRVLFLTPQARLGIFWGVHGITALCAVFALVLFISRRSSVRRVAYELGARIPGGDAERYVTLDSVLRGPADASASPLRTALLAQLQQATEDQSRGVHPARLVRDHWLPRLALAVLGGMLLCAVLAALPGYQFPLMVRRFLAPGANLPKPSFVHIRVTPEKLVLGRGEEAVIQAEMDGDIPAVLAWAYRLAGAAPGRCLMATVPGRAAEVRLDPTTARDLSRVQRRLFVFSQAELENSFSYRLRCGDAETAVHFVEVVAQPRITSLRLLVKPPAYTHRPPAEILNPRQAVQLFPGTQVELLFTVDQDVPERRLLLGTRQGPAPKWDPATRTGRYAFTMQDKVDLEIRVRNARGFQNTERARVSLLRLDDRAPQVQLDYPAGDLTVVPGELIPVQALAEDDLEVAQARFRFQLNPETNPDAPFQELPLTVPEPHGTRLSLTENFDLAQTTAGPGDELLLVVRVRDSAGNDTESRPVRLRVTAFTRGENERRRLLALDALHTLLAGLAAKPPAAAMPALDSAVFEIARKQLAAAGLVLDPASSIDSVARFLEVEQHFTDAPRHKEDVRELCAVLYAAWVLGELPAAHPGSAAAGTRPTTPDRLKPEHQPVAASRDASHPPTTVGAVAPPWPQRLDTEVLTPMLRSRRLQNVLWRIFGLQYEGADIRRRLTELDADSARQGAAQRQALEAFILRVTEGAAARQDIAAALQKELDLRRQVSELKAKAAPARQAEGEEVANPFAPVQLDVEVSRLKPEDEKKVSQLTKQLDAAVAERRRLAADAVRQAMTAGAAALKASQPGLTPQDLEMLAATALDRALRPKASGATATLPGPEARRAVVQELVSERLRSQGAGESAAHRSLARRADLYFKALQDMGVDLAAAAEGTRALDAAALKTLQGELNTAGYYLNRGGQAKNIASCDDVIELLGRLLATVRPAVPPLLRDEQQARDRLHFLYSAAWTHAASAWLALPGHLAQPALTTTWLDADLRMLERNPFAPLAPRLRDVALAETGPDTGPGPARAPMFFLEPFGTEATAIAADLRAARLLALDWELGELLADGRLSATEKALAARLLAMTAAQFEAKSAADTAPAERAFLTLPLTAAAGVPPGDPATFIRASFAATDAAAAESALLKAARGQLPLGQPLAIATRVLARATAATKAVDALEASVSNGDANVATVLATATDAINQAVRQYEQLVRVTALDIGYLEPLAATTAHEERFFLRLREAVGRYRGRAGVVVQSLTSARGRELDAAQLSSLGADLTIVKAGVQALHAAMKTASDGYAAAEAGPKYPIQEVFAESRAWVGTAQALATASKPAEVAARFVEQFAAARLEYLDSRSTQLATAAKELQDTAALAEAGTATPARLNAGLTALRQALGTFQTALGKAGTGPFQERCRQDTADLLARSDKLTRAQSAGDAALQRRSVLELTELLKDTQRLLRRVRAEVDTVGGPVLEYAGGPDRIWLQETRLDAEVARQRLLGQLRQGRRRFTLGVLDAMETPPAPGPCRELVAWSLLSYRVARSPLSGVVTPARTDAAGDAARNPLAKWLLDQLQEAAAETRAEDSLRNYPGISRELILSLKDYLRY